MLKPLSQNTQDRHGNVYVLNCNVYAPQIRCQLSRRIGVYQNVLSIFSFVWTEVAPSTEFLEQRAMKKDSDESILCVGGCIQSMSVIKITFKVSSTNNGLWFCILFPPLAFLILVILGFAIGYNLPKLAELKNILHRLLPDLRFIVFTFLNFQITKTSYSENEESTSVVEGRL